MSTGRFNSPIALDLSDMFVTPSPTKDKTAEESSLSAKAHLKNWSPSESTIESRLDAAASRRVGYLGQKKSNMHTAELTEQSEKENISERNKISGTTARASRDSKPSVSDTTPTKFPVESSDSYGQRKLSNFVAAKSIFFFSSQLASSPRSKAASFSPSALELLPSGLFRSPGSPSPFPDTPTELRPSCTLNIDEMNDYDKHRFRCVSPTVFVAKPPTPSSFESQGHGSTTSFVQSADNDQKLSSESTVRPLPSRLQFIPGSFFQNQSKSSISRSKNNFLKSLRYKAEAEERNDSSSPNSKRFIVVTLRKECPKGAHVISIITSANCQGVAHSIADDVMAADQMKV